MIIITQSNLARAKIDEALGFLSGQGSEARTVSWREKTLLVTRAKLSSAIITKLEEMGVVERLVTPSHRAQLASREFQKEKSVVRVGSAEIGAGRIAVIAGPCSVESWDQLLEAGSEANARAKGTLRLEGKDYIVQDGDVMHIRHSG